MKKHYKAQALAIIMIILIISSMIGFAVFARSQKSKKMAIQERNSSEAYQVADMILDNLLLSTLEQWLAHMEIGKTYEERYDEINASLPSTPLVLPTNAQVEIQQGHAIRTTEISNLTEALGHPLNLQDLDICPLEGGPNNKYALSLTRVKPSEVITIKPGQTFSFVPKQETRCTLIITVEEPIHNDAGLMTNVIYQDGGDILGYDYPNTTSYRFDNGYSNFTGNWVLYQNPIEINLRKNWNTDVLAVGLTAINNEINFSYELVDLGMPWISCNDFDIYKLQASATCGGTYRAKEVIIPAERYTHSIFNYVFFNGLGRIGTDVQ